MVCRKKDPPKVLQKDLPHIRCDTCKKFAQATYAKASDIIQKRTAAKVSPKRKSKLAVSEHVGEEELEEMLEKACDTDTKGGRWITHLDIVQDGQKLILRDMGGPGHCKRECKTVEKACKDLWEDIQDNDLASVLFNGLKSGMSSDKFERKVCNKWSDVCKQKKMKPVRANRKDFPWEEKSEKDLQMDDLMASMKQAGLGGTLYNRDDLDSMVGDTGDEGGMDKDEV